MKMGILGFCHNFLLISGWCTLNTTRNFSTCNLSTVYSSSVHHTKGLRNIGVWDETWRQNFTLKVVMSDMWPVIETSSFWRAQLSRFILPHQPEDGDRSSLRNVVVFCLLHTRRWIESKISPIVLYNIHHRQNPFKSIYVYCLPTKKEYSFDNLNGGRS
jgi:hypothetical protein